MNEGEMKSRFKKFALRVIRLVKSLEDDFVARTVGKQLLRCATSVGANYRAACRGRSKAEFRAKLAIAEEEADESIYWMELLIESETVRKELLTDLLQEANEIVAILVTSIKTARETNEPTSK